MGLNDTKPSWAEMFMSRYHFRVRFRNLKDGRQPQAVVQVISYDLEHARQKAIQTARSMFRHDQEVLNAACTAEGYVMYPVEVKK